MCDGPNIRQAAPINMYEQNEIALVEYFLASGPTKKAEIV